MKERKLLIACGGTGGHIFPAIALADAVRQTHPQTRILFAGVFNSHVQEKLKEYGYEVECIKAEGMPYGFNILMLPFLIRALSSLRKAFRVLKQWRPDAVVSMGSFSGGPFVVAARLSDTPTLIHEQNVVPGRANRISAYFADRIAVSFDETTDFFSRRLKPKIICTGNPVRREILGSDKNQAFDFLGLDKGKFTVLVMGGSQGAHRINMVFAEAARSLDKNNFQVLHLAGKTDFVFVAEEYKKTGIANRVFSFLDNMAAAYAVSDLVVSRSGAITVTEITASGLASILIPYPFADGHQKENAKVLVSAGAALVIQDKNLNAGELVKIINSLAADRAELNRMKTNSKGLAEPAAAENLAKEVIKLLAGHEIS